MKSSCRPILLAALGIFCSACKDPSQNSALPFKFTNLVHGVSTFSKTPKTETILHFTNGTWFGHLPDRASLGFGTSDYEITVFFDSSNRAVTKIIQQITIGTNQYWLTDRDGDGVPDQRQAFGNKTEEVLFQGQWSQVRGKSSRELDADTVHRRFLEIERTVNRSSRVPCTPSLQATTSWSESGRRCPTAAAT